MSSNDPRHKEGTSLHLGQFVTPASPPSVDPLEGPTVTVKKAVREVVEGKHIAMPRDAGPLTPEQMLATVSYCYTKGVVAASEIEESMLKDTQVRQATHGEVPRASVIRRFRVLNKDIIRATLEKTFGLLRRQQKPAAAGAAGPSGTSGTPGKEAEETAEFSRQQTQKRLDQAAMLDNNSSD